MAHSALDVYSERRYRVNEQWYNLKPHALAEYRVGQQHTHFWLEWDRGTMNVRDLVVKFTSYEHYIASREWTREHQMLPVLVCVAPDIVQERRVRRVAQDRLTQSAGLIVWTTTKGCVWLLIAQTIVVGSLAPRHID